MHSYSLRNLLLTWIVLGVISSVASAGVLLQRGVPQAAAALGTHGMHLKPTTALHQIMPKGWSLDIEPHTRLPGHISWNPADTWLKVVSRISARANVSALVDWPDRVLLIKPLSASLAESGKHAGGQKSTLPVKIVSSPRVSQDIKVLERSKNAKTRLRTAVITRPRSNPIQTAALRAREEAAVQAGLRPLGPINPARSFYAESAKQVLQSLADHYHLHLEWHGPNFPLPGPVTLLLSGNLEQDVALLQRALGPYAPLSITYYMRSKELVVRHSLYASYAAYVARPKPIPPHRSLWQWLVSVFHESSAIQSRKPGQAIRKPVVSRPEQTAVPVVLATAHAEKPTTKTIVGSAHRVAEPLLAKRAPLALPKKVQAPRICPQLVLTVAAKARLSISLEMFLNAHDWSLSWKVPYDMRATAAGKIVGPSISAILSQLLPGLGLSYHMNAALRTVVVTTKASTASAGKL